MSTIIAASALAALGVLIAMKLHAGRPCRESRSVLLHVPIEVAWTRIRDFGALQAAHGRGRPLLRVESSKLQRGDGLTPGTVWRQEGRWGDQPWWAEIEIISVEPPRWLEVTLLRDVFGTRYGLEYHRCFVELKPEGADSTKLSFRLRARTRGARLTLARTFSPERLSARLLDLGLRSLKVEVDRLARSEPETGQATAVAPTAAPSPADVPAGITADVPATRLTTAGISPATPTSRPMVHHRA